MFFNRAKGIRFLPSEQISAGVLSLIKSAEQRLVLVTPYLKPWNHLRDAILDKAREGLEVSLIVRADELEKAEPFLRLFAEAGVVVLALERLHAKLYLSDSEAIHTSMNLLETSALNSWESAISISAKDAPDFYKEFSEQVRTLQAKSSRVELRSVPAHARDARKDEPRRRSRSAPGNSLPTREQLIGHLGIKKTQDLAPKVIEARRHHPRAYESWSKAEDELVEQLSQRGLSPEVIANLTGRQPTALEIRLKEQGRCEMSAARRGLRAVGPS
ncbi:phosphatidylserine/phosphatidylglycerophosphate/cardiolipin synthase family protein [Vitiosangium sp. GDMCC 1.1324]|uniref:phospholipase D-like domain-containing protein n=1 Tax=Vitiosangium sp. (strain GDMCC 1.1324) TaxID=2138576 RepID=UPI00130E42E0|nr:phospholipase D-like domain-containing protein [Vitiosangium sp. GDMCC 1.1324]